MCGICGIAEFNSKSGISRELLERMADAIKHRGPDDGAYYIDDAAGVGFGHRRLSIIDLSTGNQPMSNLDGTACIIYNGEVYNYRELRKELETKGWAFRTTSDTEVVLRMYEEYGEKGFARLNGIFAFAIYDKKRGAVVLARDHYGVKPLYYHYAGGRLLFGSEIKTILEHPSVGRDLDADAFNSFLTFRYNPSPQTLFRGIHKLRPGHYLRADRQGATEQISYWDYRPKTNLSIEEPEAIAEYQRLLEQAVERQMVADVPVGLMLSGGVDSAIIGHLMQKRANGRIKTFSIGFPGQGDYNELDDARRSAEFIGSEHCELTITGREYLDFFFRSFYYTEEPIAEATIPALYHVSKLAAKHLKVVLSGQGADEPLAGYHRYIGERYLNRYHKALKALPLETVAAMLPRNERLKRAAYASQFEGEAERFLGIYTIFTPKQKNALLLPDVRAEMKNADLAIVSALHAGAGGLADSLDRLLYVDARLNLSDDLLLFGDKMTMANSLEGRVPFLDLDLMAFLEALPSRFKLRGRTGKYIHKKAMGKWLPDEIVYRKKRGFQTPVDEWLQSDLADAAMRLFGSPRSACRRYFDLECVRGMIEKHRSRRENYLRHLFALLSFELWHQSFFENRAVEDVVEGVLAA